MGLVTSKIKPVAAIGQNFDHICMRLLDEISHRLGSCDRRLHTTHRMSPRPPKSSRLYQVPCQLSHVEIYTHLPALCASNACTQQSNIDFDATRRITFLDSTPLTSTTQLWLRTRSLCLFTSSVFGTGALQNRLLCSSLLHTHKMVTRRPGTKSVDAS